jgi:hypothetical protein
MMRSLVLIVAISSALAACTQTVSGCPPLVTYPAAFQKDAAAELRALPKGSRLATMTVDYGKLRDACRVGMK